MRLARGTDARGYGANSHAARQAITVELAGRTWQRRSANGSWHQLYGKAWLPVVDRATAALLDEVERLRVGAR